jgi:hypothetical protein
MRLLVALPVILAAACAGMSSSNTRNTTASSQACGDLVEATAIHGAIVYPGPDSTLKPSGTINKDTQVCASANPEGFGFRRVKLANGNSGYIAESSLSM